MSQTLLLTGAAGRIGTYLTAHWRTRYQLVLSDITSPADLDGLPFVPADLADLPALQAACRGVETVVHLGADPRIFAPWESLLPNNIIGLYNLFEAARQAGCRRVIYASSINAVAGYPRDVQVHTAMPVRPLNLYGASKVWGEAVACLYADQHDLSAICLRLGAVVDHDDPRLQPGLAYLDKVLTMRDLEKLFRVCVDAPPDLRFGIFHGISDNRYKWLDISDTRTVLGYQPEDDAFALAEQNAAHGGA